MNAQDFDPFRYYASYPEKVISRPGYPARAAFKSALLWNLYGNRIHRELDGVAVYADIGGCFGFSANAMAFHISKSQGTRPRTMVFEIASDFVRIGKMLFPTIEFVEEEFEKWSGDPEVFDLVTLFDVVEHLLNPESLLRFVSLHAKYVLLKTPMETTGEWCGSCPPQKKGGEHPDGHVNFFSPEPYERLLEGCGLNIISSRLVRTIVPPGAELSLIPERMPPGVCKTLPRLKQFLKMPIQLLPVKLTRKVFGYGDHLCLCRSRLLAR